jgi:hypothetical protein
MSGAPRTTMVRIASADSGIVRSGFSSNANGSFV